MPTLGEFIERAKLFGFAKRTISVPGLGRIRYLKRDDKPEPKIVDLPPIHEGQRLSRDAVETLCENTGIPREDFGLDG